MGICAHLVGRFGHHRRCPSIMGSTHYKPHPFLCGLLMAFNFIPNQGFTGRAIIVFIICFQIRLLIQTTQLVAS